MILPILSSLTLMCWSPQITDGDTIRCNGERVRIWGIDTPERGQPGFYDATANMVRLTRGKVVRCEHPPTGRQPRSHGRLVLRCTVGGTDLGRAQIGDGHAVELPKFSKGYYAK